jgi:hypothetical protein
VFIIVQKIGYDVVTQDDVPGFNLAKNPVLYKIDSDGSDMFFSFQGDRPQYSVDGVAWNDFYAGATDRKVYNCNYLDTNWSIGGAKGEAGLTNLQLIIEEGSAQLNYAVYVGFFGSYDRSDSWMGDDARCTLTNVHDSADTMTMGEIVDSAFVGQPRNFEYWGTGIGRPGNNTPSGARFSKQDRSLFVVIRTIGQDYFYSGSINWKMRKS